MEIPQADMHSPKDKLMCECGSEILTKSRAKHIVSKKHQDFVKSGCSETATGTSIEVPIKDPEAEFRKLLIKSINALKARIDVIESKIDPIMPMLEQIYTGVEDLFEDDIDGFQEEADTPIPADAPKSPLEK
jgi:hypothetical protein